MLYLLGAMLLSMALQLDRHGLWNLLGPSLFALGILATAWVRAGRAVCIGGKGGRLGCRALGICSQFKVGVDSCYHLLFIVYTAVLAGAFRSQLGLMESLSVAGFGLGSRALHF